MERRDRRVKRRDRRELRVEMMTETQLSTLKTQLSNEVQRSEIWQKVLQKKKVKSLLFE